MEREHLSRKLAVILHADVVGSTSLVQKNETLAHERIQTAFHQFSETIKSYGGITRELRGDALVAEFDRTSDAVAAALAFQVSNGELNATLDDGIQPQMRMGISLGEVVIADNTITGAGVVLAQRLEQLADSGGVVVQGSVSETVPTRMPFNFESMGEQTLKGFEEPVRAFAARLRPGEELPEPETDVTPKPAEPKGLEVPDKPSIAVLPFTNMSGDTDQEYFSDGITEDIITELSRFRTLLVIARNSSFSYKGQSVIVQEVATNLGVEYVVEGSVRKAGNRLRIVAQLIEGSTGNNVWAERYDRELEDVFAVQDEVSQTIVSMIAGRIEGLSAERTRRKIPESLTAYDLMLQGLQEYNWHTRESLAKAKHLFQEAICAEPEYARPHAYLAMTMFTQWFYVFSIADGDEIGEAGDHARKALELDSHDSLAHAANGFVQMMAGNDEECVVQLDLAIRINPNDAEVLHWMGFIHAYLGRPQEAIEWLKVALRLNPLHQQIWLSMGIARYLGGCYEQALDALIRDDIDERWKYCYMAAAHGQLGNLDEAQSLARKFVMTSENDIRLRGDPLPDNTLAFTDDETAFFRRREDIEHLLAGLRKAGLSD